MPQEDGMEKDTNLLRRMFGDYRGLGVGTVVLLVLGQLIKNRLVDWANAELDALWKILMGAFSQLQIPAAVFLGWILTFAGIALLIVWVVVSQRAILRDVAEWKQKTKSKGLQVIQHYHHYVNQGRDRFIEVILRNDENVPLSVIGRLSPVYYRGRLDSAEKITKMDRETRLLGPITMDPKQTYSLRIAMTNVEKEQFLIDGGGSDGEFDKLGHYRYWAVFDGKTVNSQKRYEVEFRCYLQYWGGSDLSLIHKMPDETNGERVD
jgi:heme exporter protein D